MSRSRWLCATVPLLAILAGCSWSDDGNAATLWTEQVAFVSDRDGNFDVFLLDVATGAITNLTAHDAMEFGFSWSPDGQRIAFMSDRSGNRDIYSMEVPDGEAVRLTQHEARDGAPAWSPDGTQIAFVSQRDSDSGELYVMASDGSDVRRVTNNDRYEEVPSFSPDGNTLAYGAVAPSDEGAEPTLQIFSVDLASGTEVQLTRLAGHNSAPRWSPDGSRIAFYGQVGEGFAGANLLVMSADGSDLANVTDDAEPDWQPDWSSDGSRLVFARGPGTPLDLWVVGVDGRDMQPLRVADDRDEQPAWRPRVR